MNEKALAAYVTKADGRTIHVNLLDSSFELMLKDIGFSYCEEHNEYLLKTIGNSEKVIVFEKLRDLNIAFSDGKEWCPSEVFKFFRKNNFLTGEFIQISWVGPGEYKCTLQ